jgi:hypothetical protein
LVQAWSLWIDDKAIDLVDSTLAKSCSATEALQCIQIGLLCVQHNPNSRPLMSSVVTMLENETTPLPVPNSLCISHTGEGEPKSLKKRPSHKFYIGLSFKITVKHNFHVFQKRKAKRQK